jgi:hypothetical protein
LSFPFREKIEQTEVEKFRDLLGERKVLVMIQIFKACIATNLLLLFFCLGGCAYKVQVQGYQSPDHAVIDPSGATLHVEKNTEAGAGKCPVDEAVFTAMVEELARQHGFRIAERDEADFVLTFEYVSVGYGGRVRLQPHSGPTQGFKTVGKGGPYDHQLVLRVADTGKLDEGGQMPVVWAGSASLDAAPTEGNRFVAMLLLAAFEEFPFETEEVVVRKINLSDPRVTDLKK